MLILRTLFRCSKFWLFAKYILAVSKVDTGNNLHIQRSSVQSLSCVWLFATPWIAARQASLSITNSWSSLKLTFIESVMISSHLISVIPFLSCPQSLSASEFFPMSQLLAWGGQSTGVSALASFLPKKSQGWSPLKWTGWISLQSKGTLKGPPMPQLERHVYVQLKNYLESYFFLLAV